MNANTEKITAPVQKIVHKNRNVTHAKMYFVRIIRKNAFRWFHAAEMINAKEMKHAILVQAIAENVLNH